MAALGSYKKNVLKNSFASEYSRALSSFSPREATEIFSYGIDILWLYLFVKQSSS